jgi:integrase
VLSKLELLKQQGTGQVGDTRRLTVNAWLGEWLGLKRTTWAEATSRRYEELARLRIAPGLGGMKLAKLTIFHVEKWLTDMGARGITPRGAQMAYFALFRALKAAVKMKLIPSNVAADVENKPSPPKPQIQVYTEEQASQLLAATEGHRLTALLVVAMDSGARQGELFALTWEDVNFRAGSMSIRYTLQESKDGLRRKQTKTKKGRQVDLSSFAMDALQDHRKRMFAEGHARSDGPVFCDTIGSWLRKSNFIRKTFRVWQKAAGVPLLRFHSLRHFAATALMGRGQPTKVVSERLGHSSIVITSDVYSHVLPTMQQNAARAMDTFFRQQKTGS